MNVVRIAITILLTLASTYSYASKSRDDREIEMADQAIFWSLAASASPLGQLECSRTQVACSDDRAELALALLAAKSSPRSISVLANLLRYRIDAGLAEDFTCFVLARRPSTKYLSRLSASKLRQSCEIEVKQAVEKNPQLLNGVAVNSICTSEDAINTKRIELLVALSKGKTCEPDLRPRTSAADR